MHWQCVRDLDASDNLDVGMDATVYALDSTTIDLCLSLFDLAPFRSTKAAVRMPHPSALAQIEQGRLLIDKCVAKESSAVKATQNCG